jgi:N-glycosylase/DNA lyase
MTDALANYPKMKSAIEKRLSEFDEIGKGNGKALFEELAFCILTPQSKAKSCDAAIRELKGKGLLFSGSAGEIARVLKSKTRFHNNKAKYLVEAREKFEADGFSRLRKITFNGSEKEAQAKLVNEVKGMGLKEAAHYLRNVGRGNTIAILDRHILKNLVKCNAIPSLPKSLTKKRYFEIEKRMEKFCKKAKIPMPHLDLLFWAEETGGIFK